MPALIKDFSMTKLAKNLGELKYGDTISDGLRIMTVPWILSIIAGIYSTETGNQVKNLTFFFFFFFLCSLFKIHPKNLYLTKISAYKKTIFSKERARGPDSIIMKTYLFKYIEYFTIKN